MIELKSIYKSFEDKDVLMDINARFENGKTNLIIGQSGSGKTVLMKSIVGLLTPERGEILYDGRNFLTMNKKEKIALRREMGMIFQSAALFDSLSVLENVELPLLYKGVKSAERKELALKALERVGLEDRADKYPAQLSGGQQQRVSIARALAGEPPVILADEPTGALDSKTGREVLEFLKQLNKEGTTIILITHDNSIAEEIRRVVRIHDGKIISDEVKEVSA